MTKVAFSTSWKASAQRRKQRKYVYNAPAHIKGKMLASPLAKDLRTKYGTRNIRVRIGDKVKVTRGQFKGTIGSVESVSVAASRVFVQKCEVVKKDGSKAKYPLHPSSVQIIEVNTKDKKRFKKGSEKQSKPAPKKAAEKPVAKAAPKVESKTEPKTESKSETKTEIKSQSEE